MEAGATLIHIVDMDGARAGHPANLEALGRVASRRQESPLGVGLP